MQLKYLTHKTDTCGTSNTRSRLVEPPQSLLPDLWKPPKRTRRVLERAFQSFRSKMLERIVCIKPSRPTNVFDPREGKLTKATRNRHKPTWSSRLNPSDHPCSIAPPCAICVLHPSRDSARLVCLCALCLALTQLNGLKTMYLTLYTIFIPFSRFWPYTGYSRTVRL